VGKIRYVHHARRVLPVRSILKRRRRLAKKVLLKILDLIRGMFQFPEALLKLIHVLRKTPQENHEEILKRIGDESKNFENKGRPTWE
jgi:hypothetical protein